jgi:peptidoglycan/xylan/chitin deacetylase (PgdA/CDA1 family)
LGDKEGDFQLRTLATNLWSVYPFRGRFVKRKFTFIHYHQVSPEVFRDHIGFLEGRFNITHLDRLLDFYENGAPLPDRCLFITFDDGWKSNYELLPFLEERGIPITIFLTTGLIGSNKSPAPLLAYNSLDSEDVDTVDYPSFGDRTLLTSEEIREMSDHVNFQSHLAGHHPVTKLTPDKLMSEMTESKETIEELTGKRVYCLAYPYNRVSPREVSAVSSSDYVFARSGARMMNDDKTNRYLLHSVGIVKKWGIRELKNTLLLSELKTLRESL